MIQSCCGTVLFMHYEQKVVIGYYVMFVLVLLTVLTCAAYIR